MQEEQKIDRDGNDHGKLYYFLIKCNIANANSLKMLVIAKSGIFKIKLTILMVMIILLVQVITIIKIVNLKYLPAQNDFI